MKKVLSFYIQGWQWAFGNWRLVLLLFAINYLFSAFATKPLIQSIQSQLGDSKMLENIYDGFDFTLISDLYRAAPDTLGIYFSFAIWLLPIYGIWMIFSNTGTAFKASQQSNDNTLKSFWSGGSQYFFRISRLTCYYLLLLIAMLFILAKLGFDSGTNILMLENEDIIIQKTYRLAGVTIILIFLLKTAFDYCKLLIVKSGNTFIHQHILTATKAMVNSKLILLALVYLVSLIVVLVIFYCIKMHSDSTMLTTIVTTLLVLARIALRLAKVAGLELLVEESMKRAKK